MSDKIDETETPDRGVRLRHDAVEFLRFFAGAAAVYLLITTVFFRVFFIPSSSMEPTLEVGDRVLVLNFAYGWSRHSLPFGVGDALPAGEGRLLGRMPKRGDVVVFRHPARRDHLIKRVIGLPGDEIQVSGGRLYINGEIVPQALVGRYRYRTYEGDVEAVSRYDENLPDGPTHAVYDLPLRGEFDDTGVFVVPDNHVFVMGDNRDRSSDSRAVHSLGPAPVENLVGRAVTVLFTLHNCTPEEGLTCPTGRILRPL